MNEQKMLFDNYRIGICTHADGVINFDIHCNHASVFSAWSKQFETLLIGVSGLKVANARNVLVDMAIEKECTHVIFIDTDHELPEDLLSILMEHVEDAMISGLICKRSYPYQQVGFVKTDDNMYKAINLPVSGYCYEVDVCAFGCTLINLSWLKKLTKPYFRDEAVCINGVYEPKRSDIIVCEMLKSVGGKIFIDTRCEIGHLTKPSKVYPSNVEDMRHAYILQNRKALYKNEFQIPVYEAAARLIKESRIERVVDLGCGDGQKLAMLVNKPGLDIVGADIDDAKLRHAAAIMPNGHFVNMDIEEKLATGFNEFNTDDLVIVADVIEHLTKPFEFLKNIPDDVTCIISTPDVSTIGKDIKVNSDHKNGWTKEEFRELLIKAGFIALEIALYKETLGYMGIIAICRKVLKDG